MATQKRREKLIQSLAELQKGSQAKNLYHSFIKHAKKTPFPNDEEVILFSGQVSTEDPELLKNPNNEALFNLLKECRDNILSPQASASPKKTKR